MSHAYPGSWQPIKDTLMSMLSQLPDLSPQQVEGTEAAFGKVYVTMTGRRGLDISPDAIDGSYPQAESKPGFRQLSKQAQVWLCQALNICDNPTQYTSANTQRVDETSRTVSGQLVRHFERIGVKVPEQAKQLAGTWSTAS